MRRRLHHAAYGRSISDGRKVEASSLDVENHERWKKPLSVDTPLAQVAGYALKKGWKVRVFIISALLHWKQWQSNVLLSSLPARRSDLLKPTARHAC